MTIKKQWLLTLVLVAVFSVTINSLILSTLTNGYFKDYMKDNYDKHLNQIVAYLADALQDENYSENQIAVDLETHLTDPITRIKVYDKNGDLISDVSVDVQSYAGNGMMNGMMGKQMGRMMNRESEEVDHADVTSGGVVLGQVNITKYSSVENSYATWMFQSSLLKNSIYSIGIVLIFAVILGIMISNRMSKALIGTAEMAQNIDLGKDTLVQRSNVKEIRVIQQSLEMLQSRFKLKQKSRKALIDQLVHQTRTPLTILKTHLEGIEDGVIAMDSEEINVCENQIENITAIITNMSSLIDAEKEETTITLEEFELGQLVKQIVNGLKAQFEKKRIDLKFTDYEKVLIKTDKYRLSQTIYNILTNAYKFTEPDGKVTVSYQVNPGHIILKFEDNGPGIRKEDQAKIFDAYFKKDVFTGSAGDGIGLYVAKENMAIINGTITVNSDLGKGSKFTLTIPKG